MTIEGKDALKDDSIWYSEIRLKGFIQLFTKAKKAPNTTANKAKTMCEVKRKKKN